MSSLRFGLGVLVLVLGLLGGSPGWEASPASAEPDFRQMYIQSKLLIKRKMYADALRGFLSLKQQTARGKKHFGVHYHLAVASYYLGRIRQSVMYINQARKLTKKERFLESLKLLSDRIQALFSPVTLRTQIPMAQVGRLRIVLKPKQPLYHPEKKRVFALMRRRWASQGVVIDSRPVYLPQGSYSLNIPRPQCLGMSFQQGSSKVTELEVKAKTSLTLVGTSSCSCTGGRVAKRKQSQFTCVCPAGSIWSKNDGRCVPAVVNKGKGPSPWIWVSVVGAAVITGSALAVYFLAVEPQQRPRDPAKLSGRLWKGTVK